jgi:hypothetical protein
MMNTKCSIFSRPCGIEAFVVAFSAAAVFRQRAVAKISDVRRNVCGTGLNSFIVVILNVF